MNNIEETLIQKIIRKNYKRAYQEKYYWKEKAKEEDYKNIEYNTLYKDSCYKIIKKLPLIDYYNNIKTQKAGLGKVWGKNGLTSYHYEIYKELAIFLEKVGAIEEAIEVCKSAIKVGYTDRTDKSGMIGRLQRLQKKLDRK